MNPCIIILIPMAANMPGELKARSLAMSQRLSARGVEVIVDARGRGDAAIATHTDRCVAVAAIRNALVQDYLLPRHTHVMTMDADLVEYPSDLPARMLAVAGNNAVVGAACYVEGLFPRWYDMKVLCDMRIRVSHANLPQYGMKWH